MFPYTNAIHHPPAILCNVGRVEATGGDYYHYYDGISPSVGRLIDALDRERLAIAAALGVRAFRFVEHFYRIGYTTEARARRGLAYEAFHQSEPDRWIRAPSSLDHRFLNEDIPYRARAAVGARTARRRADADHRSRDPPRLRGDGQGLSRAGSDARAAGAWPASTPAGAIRLLDRGYPN